MTSNIDRRALGRRLSALSNATVAEVLGHTPDNDRRDVPRIGITGAPGVGKSTLAARLGLMRSESRRVGILAVDPTSPISGGAILGDRIRLDEMKPGHELFMRSVASRSVTDGLADNLPELLEAMSDAGFDELLLETVGVGQAETGARTQVDTLLLVLMPDSGDTIQAMKAGTMELADIYVVNKCDLPGADRFAAEIRRVLALTHRARRWDAPVVLTREDEEHTVEALSEAIDAHQAWFKASVVRESVLQERARYRLQLQLERRVHEVVRDLDAAWLERPLADQFREAARRAADVASD